MPLASATKGPDDVIQTLTDALEILGLLLLAAAAGLAADTFGAAAAAAAAGVTVVGESALLTWRHDRAKSEGS